MRPARSVCLGLILLFLGGPLLSAAHYVEIRTRIANIRNAPAAAPESSPRRHGTTSSRWRTKRATGTLSISSPPRPATSTSRWHARRFRRGASTRQIGSPRHLQGLEGSGTEGPGRGRPEAAAGQEPEAEHQPQESLERPLQAEGLPRLRLPPAIHRRIVLEGYRRGW